MPNVTKEKISDSELEITITVDETDVEPFLNGAAKKLSREKPIKGFRPGKVTLEHAKKVYGEMTLYEEALKDIIKNTLPDAVREEKIQFIGYPDVSVVKCAPGNPVIYKATLTLIPKVTLADYKTILIAPKEITVDEKEVEKSIEYLIDTRAKEALVERPIKNGDHVVASLKVSLDNVPIGGDTVSDTHLLIGKDEQYPGLSKKIIGMNKSETKEAPLDIPRNFWNKQLAGKRIVVTVYVKEVYERTLPKLNDDFAKGLGPFQTVSDLKKKLKENLKDEKEMKETQRQEGSILNSLVEQSTFTKIPQLLIQDEQKRIVAESKEMLKRQGMKWDDYITHIKKTEKEIEEGYKDAAIDRLKKNLVLAELTKKLNIVVDDSEIDREWESVKAKDNKAVTIEKTDPERTARVKQHIRTMLSNRKVFEILVPQDKNKID